MTTARTYARALRFVAIIIALIAIGRQLAHEDLPPDVVGRLLALRVALVVISAVVALLCSPARSIAQLRALAFAYGLAACWTSLGVTLVVPARAWEQFADLVAIMLGAAVLMPWSERWQAAFAASVWGATAAVLVWFVPASAISGVDVARQLLTLGAIAATSVGGAYLAERNRRAVTASEARYRGLFDKAGDAIAVLDAQGVVQEANPRLAALLGLPLERILGRRLGEFTARDSGSGAMQALAAAQTGTPVRATDTLRRATGESVEVDIAFAPAGDPGRPLVQATVRDLTERRGQERRLVQGQRLDSLARFAGGIAHQFNNILGGILTHASVLRADAANAAAERELDEILEAARRGRDLTKELLGFTHHEAIVPKPIAPAALLGSVASLAQATLPKDVTVEVDLPADLPALLGDADHLMHACLQLILNARDAMAGRPNSRLTLAARVADLREIDPRWAGAAPGRYVRISVTDNGPGMDAATLERVFEPFFSTKPMHKAAGLGLAAVHSVVRDHRGAARVESAPGRGTTVHLLLPVAVAPAAEPTTGPAAVASGATILVVDDEAIVRNSLKRALTKFGYRVLEASDGGSALAQLQGAQPPVDLVILDLVLPGGGAGIFEVLKAVRPDVKVLVSSGYSPDADNAKALAARVQGFLPKPYEIKELREAVAKALNAPAPAPPRP